MIICKSICNIYTVRETKFIGIFGELIEIKMTQPSSSGLLLNEPRFEKTGLWGFRPGPTQTRLYDHTRWLEA